MAAGAPSGLFSDSRRRHKVRVIYKSGVVQDVRCADFKVIDGGRALEWVNASPRPLKIGVGEIAAIYQIR